MPQQIILNFTFNFEKKQLQHICVHIYVYTHPSTLETKRKQVWVNGDKFLNTMDAINGTNFNDTDILSLMAVAALLRNRLVCHYLIGRLDTLR